MINTCVPSVRRIYFCSSSGIFNGKFEYFNWNNRIFTEKNEISWRIWLNNRSIREDKRKRWMLFECSSRKSNVYYLFSPIKRHLIASLQKSHRPHPNNVPPRHSPSHFLWYRRHRIACTIIHCLVEETSNNLDKHCSF